MRLHPEPTCSFFLILFRSRRAHANSVANTARPAGITMKAGPGRIIIKAPMQRMLPPMMATIHLRACLYSPNRRLNTTFPDGLARRRLAARMGRRHSLRNSVCPDSTAQPHSSLRSEGSLFGRSPSRNELSRPAIFKHPLVQQDGPAEPRERSFPSPAGLRNR